MANNCVNESMVNCKTDVNGTPITYCDYDGKRVRYIECNGVVQNDIRVKALVGLIIGTDTTVNTIATGQSYNASSYTMTITAVHASPIGRGADNLNAVHTYKVKSFSIIIGMWKTKGTVTSEGGTVSKSTIATVQQGVITLYKGSTFNVECTCEDGVKYEFTYTTTSDVVLGNGPTYAYGRKDSALDGEIAYRLDKVIKYTN